MDAALRLCCVRGFDGNDFGFGTERGGNLIQGRGLNVPLVVLIGWNKNLPALVDAHSHERIKHRWIVGMAIRGNFWKGGRDWDDFVAEAGEPFGVQFHGKLRVERQVALLLAQFGPILRREWFGKVVGSEQDALSAGRKREHINVLDDRARQRLEVRDAFAAADFFELLVEIEVLILVAREKHARGEAAAVFQLEKISSVDGDSRSFVMEIG